jgi:hypothetical protein
MVKDSTGRIMAGNVVDVWLQDVAMMLCTYLTQSIAVFGLHKLRIYRAKVDAARFAVRDYSWESSITSIRNQL